MLFFSFLVPLIICRCSECVIVIFISCVWQNSGCVKMIPTFRGQKSEKLFCNLNEPPLSKCYQPKVRAFSCITYIFHGNSIANLPSSTGPL